MRPHGVGDPPGPPRWRHFDYTVDRGVATLTLARPERLNALTFAVYADLRDLLGELAHSDDVRVLVITGQGTGFCSGGDVHEIIGKLLEMDPAFRDRRPHAGPAADRFLSRWAEQGDAALAGAVVGPGR